MQAESGAGAWQVPAPQVWQVSQSLSTPHALPTHSLVDGLQLSPALQSPSAVQKRA